MVENSGCFNASYRAWGASGFEVICIALTSSTNVCRGRVEPGIPIQAEQGVLDVRPQWSSKFHLLSETFVKSGRSGRAAAAGPFQESDEDEDFAAPPKRARPAGRRLPLDEKVFQRDLEVTLALSLNKYVGNKDKTQEKDRLAEPKAASQDFKQEAVISTPETDNDENLRASQENAQPHLEMEFGSSESVGKPLKTSSPSVAKKPSWTPPGASGSKTTLLGRAPVKSPVQGLRLGLSRHAKVKPLHPHCAGT